MKLHRNIIQALTILSLGFIALQATAQKVEFETVEINYIDIIRNAKGIKLRGNFLVFDNNNTLSISNEMKVQKVEGDLNVSVTLIGEDVKGNKFSKSVEYIYSKKGENKGGNLEIKGSSKEPIFISTISIEVKGKNGFSRSASETILNSNKSSFAILLNGVNSNELCSKKEVNSVFMNESSGSKYYAVVLGLNNTKKQEPSAIEKSINSGFGQINGKYVWSVGNDKRISNMVQPTMDKNGNWTFKDSVEIGKEKPVLISFELLHISACNDSWTYTSMYRLALKEKSAWDYKIHMATAVKDSPELQTITGNNSSVLALTFPSSSISVSGGSIVFSESTKFEMGISGTTVSNGGINYNKVPKVKYNIKNWDGNGRVFYHWGSTVSTSNPKVAVDVDSMKFKGHELASAELRFITEGNDTIVYQDNGKLATSLDGKTTYLLLKKTKELKYKDPCKTKFKLKEITYSETTVSGIYALQFSFELEQNSDLPTDMAMIVEIKDCNGNKEYISISLKYNAKTGIYSGGVSMTQIKECAWQLVYGEIAAYNSCKDKTVWSFEASNSKSNGSGTRNVATANNGKPGLL